MLMEGKSMANEFWSILKEEGLPKGGNLEDLEVEEEILVLQGLKAKKPARKSILSIFMMKVGATNLFVLGRGRNPIKEMEGRGTTGEMIGKMIIGAMKTISLGNYF